MTTELITGNTYPVRHEMKRLGGEWQPRLQGWAVPTPHAEEARRLVAAAGPAPARPAYPARRRSCCGCCS